jgi:hypothetical protein
MYPVLLGVIGGVSPVKYTCLGPPVGVFNTPVEIQTYFKNHYTHLNTIYLTTPLYTLTHP